MDFKKLETMLKKFDWTSEDVRGYIAIAGETSRAELKCALLTMMLVDFERTRRLYEKYKIKHGANLDRFFLQKREEEK